MSTKLGNKKSQIWTGISLFLLVVLLIASYKFKSFLIPAADFTIQVDPACDLRKGACTAKLPEGGIVRFSIEPKSMPLLKSLKLQLKLEGVEVEKVKVAFVGVDMDMGFNQVTLEAVDQYQYEGNGLLSICTRTKMEWEARVMLYTNNGLVVAPFRFYTIKP